MQTFRPAPERTVNIQTWAVNELENEMGYEFITPSGYVFGFSSKKDVLDWMADISWIGMQHGTMYGDIHEVNASRVICVWIPDPWINKGWEHLQEIVRVSEFMDIAVAYICERWIG